MSVSMGILHLVLSSAFISDLQQFSVALGLQVVGCWKPAHFMCFVLFRRQAENPKKVQVSISYK